MVWLILKECAVNGQEYRLHPDKCYVIGRNARAAIRVIDPKASRNHCSLSCEDGLWHVFDLESTNGTFLDGQRVQKAQIGAGDRLMIGSWEFDVQEEPIAQRFSDVLSELQNQPPADADPGEPSPQEPLVPAERQLACTTCGIVLPADAESIGRAIVFGGKTYCVRCGLTAEQQRNSAAAGGKLFDLLSEFEPPDEPKSPKKP